jgi:hypothetical protein
LQLLFLQPYIQSVYFHDLNLCSCDSAFLPRLNFVRARPWDAALLVARRPVRAIRILYGTHDYEEWPVVPLNFIVLSTAQVIHLELQVSQLLSVHDPRDLTTLLPHVREMVVIQDRTWGTKRDPTVCTSSRFNFELENRPTPYTDEFHRYHCPLRRLYQFHRHA